jgi:uncharacterized protein
MVQTYKSLFMDVLNRKCLIPILLFLFVSGASLGREVPKFTGHWVIDETGSLSGQAIQELEMYLQHQRDSTSNQLAIYMIKSLEGDDIDDYAERVFKEWKLGQESKDNGVLLLISLGDRQAKIEVGIGLEGVLTDLLSSRINRNEIFPHFKRGDIESGVKAGVLAIDQAIKGEYTNEEPTRRKKSSRSNSMLPVLLILAIIIFISRRRGGGSGGYWTGGSGWIGPMGGGGFSSGGGSWSDFGGGGISGGGGSSDSW